MKSVEVQVLPPEIQGDSMVDLLRGGAAITKVENETLAQMAVMHPRSLERVKEKMLEELNFDPEAAASNYYVLEYAGNKVEGLSAAAARTLLRCMGNMTASSRIFEENDHAVIVDGVCIDMESGTRFSTQVAVSKFYRSRKTKEMIKWAEDRFPQILAAGAAKAVRNAILGLTPESIKKTYWNRARELAAGGDAPKDPRVDRRTVIGKILAAFEPYKIGREHLEARLKCKLEDAKSEELADLRGIFTAIEQGQTTPYDAFQVGFPPEKEDPPANKPEKGAEELFGGNAS